MNFSRLIKTIPTYAACLMLALAIPASAYATDDTSIQNNAATEQQVPASSSEQEPSTQPEHVTTIDQPIPPVESQTQSQPEQTPASQPDTTNKKYNNENWQWDSAKQKYVRIKQNKASNDSSSSTGSNSTKTNSDSDTKSTTSIENALNSNAISGNANIKDNGNAGNATSGNSAATATVLNNYNSSINNANNKEAATFVKDIYGDVNGDLMLEPMLLKAMLEANASQNQSNTSVDNKVNMTNGVNLNATSGNAKVKDNRNAGNATSGSADTVANVVNMVNSMVAANQSFNGTVNIYGNLNGDILIAPDFMAQMIANNGSNAKNDGKSVTKVNSRDTQEIVNNVSLAAQSGNALVRDNNQAGNATTGEADTNLVIFNLSGHDVIASNSLLVFINVLGQWVGVIVDAPAGATAAAVGNNVTTNTVKPSIEVDATNDAVITNNINLVSNSGNAVVADNGTAGNATTGRATASANIANVSNSTMGLSGWFGVLFINVFGTWNGSFGIDTVAGNPIASNESSQASGNAGVIQFIPREQRTDRSTMKKITFVNPGQDASQEVQAVQASETKVGEVKGANDTKSDIPSQQTYIDNRKEFNIPLAAVSLIAIIGSGYVLRKFLF